VAARAADGPRLTGEMVILIAELARMRNRDERQAADGDADGAR
jgi:hypothetical protein